jgi:hypothetical protein
MKSAVIAKLFEQPVISFSFSDISELTLGVTGLRVVVSFDRTHDDEDRYLEVLFSIPRGFRFLDEGDLLSYWGVIPVQAGHTIFEVKQGGWMEQEQSYGMLNVTSAIGDFREWLIVSSNGCLSVISKIEPMVRFIQS